MPKRVDAVLCAVQSSFATPMLSESVYFAPSFSHSGASFLQWPHHGA